MEKIAFITTIPTLTPRQQLQLKALTEDGFDVKAICWDRSGTHLKKEIQNGIHFLRIQPYHDLNKKQDQKSGSYYFMGIQQQKRN